MKRGLVVGAVIRPTRVGAMLEQDSAQESAARRFGRQVDGEGCIPFVGHKPGMRHERTLNGDVPGLELAVKLSLALIIQPVKAQGLLRRILEADLGGLAGSE